MEDNMENIFVLGSKNYKEFIDTRTKCEKCREQYKAPYELCCVYDCGNHEECKKCQCDMYRELGGVAGFGADT